MSYNIVAENPETTVVSEYAAKYRRTSAAYQSEADLEETFIADLCSQGYEALPITREEDLIANLRRQLEALNAIKFSDAEWVRFFRTQIANAQAGIVEKTRMIQEDPVRLLERDNGTTKNIRLIDKDNIHENSLQVIHQYVPSEGLRKNRYDVTILVNGLPLVHVELKRRGVDIKEAFNQICRYGRESFWHGAGLFDFVQIFVISNGTWTKYYSNTTRERHIREKNAGGNAGTGGGKRTSNSFEFTSFWSDARNRRIADLRDFTRTFLTKTTLLNVLSKYCVFTADESLLVMRPYQIAATERIVSRIKIAKNTRLEGKIDAGGFVWHTTGSGKTLTSFKTAQLASRLDGIDKVLFVVDRKDLDYQTMQEYDRFARGAANSNANTRILKKQLEDDSRIIITTIQKLAIFIRENKGHAVFGKHVVLIFDECHRSQFGDMHTAIVRNFKKYYLFGFTGTPIFAENAGSAKNGLGTTEQIFGKRLHTYTIVDAINDKNVLPFRMEYVRTIGKKNGIEDKMVSDIDRKSALDSPARRRKIVEYVLEHFNQKTKRSENYDFSKLQNIAETACAKRRAKSARGNAAHKELKATERVSGFNSIFAADSIENAKKYYAEFKEQMKAAPGKRLKIALIYSCGVNEGEADGILGEENSEDTSGLDKSSRDFLDAAIRDYNKMFGVNYDTSSEKFQNYYRDVSLRMKNRDLDLLIVVNMFLTGFDATTLNTLWGDKNLRSHGLLQAFSRTNRILNSIKTFGNIVCFRNLEEQTNEAIALFGNEDAGGIVLLKKFDDYYGGFEENGKRVEGYRDLISRLQKAFPLDAFDKMKSEKNKKEFARLFGTVLQMRNILSAFDEFKGREILSAGEFQDYQGHYIGVHDEFRKRSKNEPENINDDLVFEMELVRQIDINIDYILAMTEKYRESFGKNKDIRVEIRKAINASVDLRNKRDLIERFIDSLNGKSKSDLLKEWKKFAVRNLREDLDSIIEEERLNPEKTEDFVRAAFRDREIRDEGTEFSAMLPPISRFSENNELDKKREVVFEKLETFFTRYADIVDPDEW